MTPKWSRMFNLTLVVLLACSYLQLVLASDTESISSEDSEERTDIFTSTTFMSRLMGYATNSHTSSPLHRNIYNVLIIMQDDKPPDEKVSRSQSIQSQESVLTVETDDKFDMSKIFDKYKGDRYSEEEYDRKLKEILGSMDPYYGTNYNREWGRACMTEDYRIPNTEYLIHFDIFDPFTPPGLDFEDLRCLHLYNVKEGYNLYKIKMGDMIITLRPNLDQVSVHLFEDFWGLMIVRVLYSVDGVLQKHEYTEQSRGSRTFQKSKGPAIYYSTPDADISDLNKWLDEKYSALSKHRPPIIEEVMYYSNKE